MTDETYECTSSTRKANTSERNILCINNPLDIGSFKQDLPTLTLNTLYSAAKGFTTSYTENQSPLRTIITLYIAYISSGCMTKTITSATMNWNIKNTYRPVKLIDVTHRPIINTLSHQLRIRSFNPGSLHNSKNQIKHCVILQGRLRNTQIIVSKNNSYKKTIHAHLGVSKIMWNVGD